MSDELERSTGVTNPLLLIQTAIEKGINPDQLGKLLDLQERWERNQAAKLFADSLTKFQSICPPVVKGNPVNNKAGDNMYMFANLDDVMSIAQPHLTACGIVVTWDTTIEGQAMKTTCHVRVGTHVEHTSVTLAIPAIPNANATQMAGGALAYGKRYSVCAALGIRVTGEDNDAQGQTLGLTDAHTVRLNELLDDCREADPDFQLQAFWDWCFKEKATPKNMNDLADKDFTRVEDMLQRKLAKVRGK